MALEPFAGVFFPRTGSKVAALKELLQVTIRRAEPFPKRADLHCGFLARTPHRLDDMSLAAAKVLHAMAEELIEV